MTPISEHDSSKTLDQFEDFTHRFKKQYQSPEERERRFRIFQRNVEEIDEHNKQRSSWQMAVTAFSDMTGKTNGALPLSKDPSSKDPLDWPN